MTLGLQTKADDVTFAPRPLTSKDKTGRAAESRRIEVVVTRDEDGRRQVLVQDMSFGSGIGWYIQKTLRLDPEHVDALLRSLCCVRHQCPEACTRGGTDQDAAEILPFRRRDVAI